MAFTQENRLISIDTPLGKDVLLLQGFTGTEGISQPFRFDCELLSDQDSIDFTKIIGQRVTISIQLTDGTTRRYINGFVSQFSQGSSESSFFRYQMQVVSSLWFLTRCSNCQIFQNMTIPEILEQVFSGYVDFKSSLTASYEPREYCVQYRETDFNFASRLMEEAGIFYYFEHENGKHTLVTADSSSVLQDCPNQAVAHYNLTTGDLDSEDVVTSWRLTQELRSGFYVLTDYNFKTPNVYLSGDEQTLYQFADNKSYMLYDYPGGFEDPTQATAVARLRMQEEETGHLMAVGTSVCRAFCSGYSFNLEDHYRVDVNDKYLLTHVQHAASVGSYTNSNQPGRYSNQFACVPQEFIFRPPRITRKPFVQGPQTAVVVGKSGEEIWVDNFGRVKVHFHWDRLKDRKDESSSCWIRVSQPWAGKGWGATWIPRVGQEVIVSFIEGDPDRPIITGRVYNADQTVPYSLPDHQTVSTFKSRSSKGGGMENFNEIRFEDKKGSEDLLIHAEHTMHNSVEVNQYVTIGMDRHVTTGYLDDGGAAHGRLRELAHDGRHITVLTDDLKRVLGGRSIYIERDHKEDIHGSLHLHVHNNRREHVEADYTLQVDGSCGTKALSLSFDVNSNVVVSAGTVVIQAQQSISINGPGGFVKIDPSGVTISGTMVLINSGGAPSAGSPMQMVEPDDPDEPQVPKTG
jgi:type VI secretion system secreted protein VgrG